MRQRFLRYFAMAVFATAFAFGVHLALNNENARLGYELADVQKRGDQLAAQRNLLALEAATLRQMDRVEAVARGSFGMDVPDPSRVITISSAQAQRLSGRTP
jgi:cell division protein FtsL